MIYIYCTNSTIYREKYQLGQLLDYLPQSLHERAKRYRFEVDAFNFVLGRLMLREGLNQLGLATDINQVSYGKNGKPFLKNVFFNISHSSNQVICALSTEGEIGIDIEKERSLELKNFQDWFTAKEWHHIYNSSAPLKTFFWYWVRKESILKALGIGLSYLHQVEINPTNNFFVHYEKKWFLKDLDITHGYLGAICSNIEINQISIKTFTPMLK